MFARDLRLTAMSAKITNKTARESLGTPARINQKFISICFY